MTATGAAVSWGPEAGHASGPAAGAAGGQVPVAGPAVQLVGVSVRLGRRPVVQDVSASVDAGRWLSVVGANGAGKSTLLRAVVGLVRHEGAIRLGGCDSAVMTNRQRARMVTMVAQNPVLPPAMSVNAYALLGRTAHLGPFGRESAEDLDRVAHALRRLDATDLATRALGSLSGGEAQRVTIARALVQDTPLLLLDEPTSSLDVGHQLAMLDLVDELRRERGLAVLSTMHDLTLAAQYADELLLLHQGTVVAAGPPVSVLCEDNLTRYYGARVRVVRHGEALVVVPLRGAPGSVLRPPQP